MKKSIFSLFTFAALALFLSSTSFDKAAFSAEAVLNPAIPTTAMAMDFDGRNFVSGTISTAGTSQSVSGTGSGTYSASVSSAGGTGSFSATISSGSSGATSSSSFSSTSTSTSSSTSSSTTTSGGFDLCDYVTSPAARAWLGCDD